MESKERREERENVVLDDIVETPHVPSTVKTANKVLAVGLLIATLGLGLILYWSLQNTKVLDIHNAPFPARTIREHPTPDGVVILSVDYCKTRNIDGEVRESFVSSSREVFVPVAPEKGPKGCQKTEVPVIIPVNLPPDTYKIKFHVTYNLNPLKKNVTQDFESTQFTVVAPGGPGSEKVVSQ